MTYHLLQLAKRAAAAPRWQRLDGMRTVPASELPVHQHRMRALGAGEAPLLFHGGDPVYIDWRTLNTVAKSAPQREEVPDFSDPVTVCGMVPLLRIVYKEPMLHTECHGGENGTEWFVCIPGENDVSGPCDSEAEALVVALERAP